MTSHGKIISNYFTAKGMIALVNQEQIKLVNQELIKFLNWDIDQQSRIQNKYKWKKKIFVS